MTDSETTIQEAEGDSLPPSRPQGLSTISVQELTGRIDKIRTARKEVMEEGIHYGTIPGTGDKPTLLKPGAEMLCSLFQLAPDPELTIKELEGDHREYIIEGGLRHIPTGNGVGSGYGSCSTKESKYRYRYIDETTDVGVPGDFWDSGDDMSERDNDILRDALGSAGVDVPDGTKTGVDKTEDGWKITISAQGENPDLADVYNTCLKMSKKRWLVDVALTVTAASELFTQDVEDLRDLKGADVGSSSVESTSRSGAKKSGQTSSDTQANGKAPPKARDQSGTYRRGDEWYKDSIETITQKLAAGDASPEDVDTSSVPKSHPIDEWPEEYREDINTVLSSGKAQGGAPSGQSEAEEGSAPNQSLEFEQKRRYDSLQDAISHLCPSAVNAGQEAPVPDDRRISEKQMKRLYAIAKDHNWKDSWLDRLVKDELGYESKNHIPYDDPYDEICDALEDQELKHWISRDPDTKDMFDQDHPVAWHQGGGYYRLDGGPRDGEKVRGKGDVPDVYEIREAEESTDEQAEAAKEAAENVETATDSANHEAFENDDELPF